ncbi:MAG: hypothetical protein UW30_C0028G0006 [Candidatus Giovannonibacteria bacterium GW2011_GWA2_44_13b]|uniref:Uncharacterized protein n=1 Tax=Candidatus Giovannonibacteria bacterium GW2011_GWA2_44_13b TaxID=1618647 RepID=A0A0G1GYM8_9BACT|nr:MAG: hypothetical protein UW30_C0028G0006 [Candidatus Giovannonibacteria bacterium GW2011_GWA2_44_13b]
MSFASQFLLTLSRYLGILFAVFALAGLVFVAGGFFLFWPLIIFLTMPIAPIAVFIDQFMPLGVLSIPLVYGVLSAACFLIYKQIKSKI